MIQKCVFKKGEQLEDTRFAPHKGEVVFLIDEAILIFEDEIIKDFDLDYYDDILEIIETVE